MSKIANAFKDGKAFIGFLTAGDPTIEKTVEYILAMWYPESIKLFPHYCI